jgi:anti-anti-sigma regulatory factor
MTLEIDSSPFYTWIRYTREGYRDLEELKAQLAVLVHAGTGQADVVIDFQPADFIVSSEIRLLVTFLKELRKQSTRLHLIASPKVKAILLSANLQKVEGFALYDSAEHFHQVVGR